MYLIEESVSVLTGEQKMIVAWCTHYGKVFNAVLFSRARLSMVTVLHTTVLVL